MAVRTTHLAVATSNPGATTNVIYTCPAGVTAILKWIQVSTSAGSPGQGIFAVRSGGITVRLLDRPWGSAEILSLATWIVLEPGDQLTVFVSSGELKFWFSGTELAGVAP